MLANDMLTVLSRSYEVSFRFLLLVSVIAASARIGNAGSHIDFNRDIRPILFSNCIQCHGPDESERKGGTEGVRLDTREGALLDLGGYAAVTPGNPDKSELLTRVTTQDADLVMPPAGSGKKLTPKEIQLLRDWIKDGASYAQHWSYVKPVRPALPEVQEKSWPRNEVDYFVLLRLEQTKQAHSPELEKALLARRVSLDLTGLPPTDEELQTYLRDTSSDAYEHLVDRLLSKPTFGEHWAHQWLDLARYADSAGYADDPERTIWLYRDYVIRSFNENKPFNQFTIEQIAGDLLPNPTPDQIVATAFHRNTMTNSEGGTDDEEFRNVAVVDRVNTTFSVWMATTMGCAQCHTHKFDPLTQTEYFQIFAILNNTKDADRKDETPLYSQYTADQVAARTRLEQELKQLEQDVQKETPELLAALKKWDDEFPRQLPWQSLVPDQVSTTSGLATEITDDVISVAGGAENDNYTLRFPLTAGHLTALQLDALADSALPGGGPGHAGGNFVISKISARIEPAQTEPVRGRYVRISIPGKKMLSLAEVQVFQGEHNIAGTGKARQSSTAFDGPAELAIDGSTDGDYSVGKSVTHTNEEKDPWWELDLGGEQQIDRIALWNRTDNGLGSRLAKFDVEVFNQDRRLLWKQRIDAAPNPDLKLVPALGTDIEFAGAFADYSQPEFSAEFVIKNPKPAQKGWAVGGATGKSHQLILLPSSKVDLPEEWVLKLTIEQQSEHKKHTLGRFRVAISNAEQAQLWARTPGAVREALNVAPSDRTQAQQLLIDEEFRKTTPLLARQRRAVDAVKGQLAKITPATVPVCEELPADQLRETRIQIRGNFQNLGDKVGPGVPAVFNPLPSNVPANRLGLAHWLVDDQNPLTARVVANRFWEQIFGIGLVSTSEDFGTQGELPSHPELLDWLAVELVDSQWNTKAFLKRLVMSATYRQSSQVSAEHYEEDPDNRLLARGPRFRLSAEMVRDQALFLSGLLSSKLFGPPVKPLQPMSGLSAAFGGKIDWKTSEGEDRYRRGIYTSWRRSNPYPSMATFDAPNREVCTVRRGRTNTPLQALVTLNDPVYVEAAQSLARKIVAEGGATDVDRARYALEHCLSRTPQKEETERVIALHSSALAQFREHTDDAQKMATDPLGPVPDKADVADLAAWTVVSNVILNLDELLMKR